MLEPPVPAGVEERTPFNRCPPTKYGIMTEDLNRRLQEIGRELFGRVNAGVFIPFREIQLGNWRPSENDCHGNVHTWCQTSRGDSLLPGFLYFDLGGLLPYVWFNPHSVVPTASGELF